MEGGWDWCHRKLKVVDRLGEQHRLLLERLEEKRQRVQAEREQHMVATMNAAPYVNTGPCFLGEWCFGE